MKEVFTELEVHSDSTNVVTHYRLSITERIRVLITGYLYHFNKTKITGENSTSSEIILTTKKLELYKKVKK